MADKLVPTIKTAITLDTYVDAVLRAWKRLLGELPSQASAGVLWAQYALETGGGAYCYCFNLGNVKHVAGDGYDYCQLQGVWEGVTKAAFEALQKTPLGPLVRMDYNPDHQKAVGPGKIPVLFDPPHPASWFRAYPSLSAAMVEHLRLLKEKRFASAWPAVEAGDFAMFADKLRSRGYYTASLASYTSGLQRGFAAYAKSGAYDRAVLQLHALDAAETEPTLPPVPEDEDIDRQPILHPFVPFPSYRGDDAPDSGENDNVMIRDVLEIHEDGCGSWEGAACNCKVVREEEPV